MYEKRDHGFWKQKNPNEFTYTEEYKKKQSTNEAMTYLRAGWILGSIPYDEFKDFKVVDVGSGNNAMENYLKDKVKEFKSYDVAGESISKEELLSTSWDLAVFADVIEHIEELEEMFKPKWKYAYISTPETPEVEDWMELKNSNWRHLKPDEHLWLLNKLGLEEYFNFNGIEVLSCDFLEDVIRTREYSDKPNIVSLLVKRI